MKAVVCICLLVALCGPAAAAGEQSPTLVQGSVYTQGGVGLRPYAEKGGNDSTPDRERLNEKIRYSGTTNFNLNISSRLKEELVSDAEAAGSGDQQLTPQHQTQRINTEISFGLIYPAVDAAGAIITAEDGAKVGVGDVLARIPQESLKTRDITGGLPRVAELFEARRPKDHAVIAEIDGRVEFGKDYKAKRRLILSSCQARRRRGELKPAEPSPFLEELPRELLDFQELEEKELAPEDASRLFARMKEGLGRPGRP